MGLVYGAFLFSVAVFAPWCFSGSFVVLKGSSSRGRVDPSFRQWKLWSSALIVAGHPFSGSGLWSNFGVAIYSRSTFGIAFALPYVGMISGFSISKCTSALGFMPGASVLWTSIYAVGNLLLFFFASGWTSPFDVAGHSQLLGRIKCYVIMRTFGRALLPSNGIALILYPSKARVMLVTARSEPTLCS